MTQALLIKAHRAKHRLVRVGNAIHRVAHDPHLGAIYMDDLARLKQVDHPDAVYGRPVVNQEDGIALAKRGGDEYLGIDPVYRRHGAVALYG